MQTHSLHVQFNTPAFMGDASQTGRWRTPPFKAQLRQWWRVAYSAQQRHCVGLAEMRDIEGHLFGHAWLEDDFNSKGNKTSSRQSNVRVRLSHWNMGKLTRWEPTGTAKHPEVSVGHIGSDLYLGYGPVALPRGSRHPELKASAAIQSGENAQLAIAYPDASSSQFDHVLSLMHLYGTVGGRGRNGWGSYHLSTTAASSLSTAQTTHIRNWTDCLGADWPHAIGSDAKGALIWQTTSSDSWQKVVEKLAQAKIDLRTLFKFPHKESDGRVHDRHWLSYPVTHHEVNTWRQLRLPNQLRFKVRTTADGHFVGVIFHMPHLPPAQFQPDAQAIESVWRRVHQHLDSQPGLQRIPA